jgi:5-methylcytosine-specific restriction endonuclease McrA
MGKRKNVSPKVRYSVLARDGFTCRYCGARADTGAQLVVDHIIPVARGGSNDPANLITACQPCNAGKSDRTPENAAPTPTDHARLLAERQRLEDVAQAIANATEARAELLQQVVNLLCAARKQDEFHLSTAKTILSFVDQHGGEIVVEWIDIAAMRLDRSVSDRAFGRYISGIRRKWLAQQQAPALRIVQESAPRQEQECEEDDEYDYEAIRAVMDAADAEHEAELRARERTDEQRRDDYALRAGGLR